MGQCAVRRNDVPLQAVSLENAKSLSSNAAVINARYHSACHGGKLLAEEYELEGEVLGSGLCGDVVAIRSRVDGRRYALKTISKEEVAPVTLGQVAAEVEIYLALDHPNIARLHNVFETGTDVYLVTECCAGGELYCRLKKKGVYTNADAAEATRQMLRAVGYLHAHHIVHRDLKLENFLYQSSEDAAQLQLIDFGFAKIWDPSTLMMASCGSVAYVSPDVLVGKGYTSKCDLWSLGVIVWMLLVGYPPFYGSEASMVKQVRAADPDWSYTRRWQAVLPDAVDFVKKLLVADPKRRLDFQEALQHPWLADCQVDGGEAVAAARYRSGALSRDVLHSLKSYADGRRVRRLVLQLLAQQLGPDETKELRNIFLAIDKSSEGTICLSDLKDAIRCGSECVTDRRHHISIGGCSGAAVSSGAAHQERPVTAAGGALAIAERAALAAAGVPTGSSEACLSEPNECLDTCVTADDRRSLSNIDRLATPSRTRRNASEEQCRVGGLSGARVGPQRSPFGSPAACAGRYELSTVSASPITPARVLRRANSGALKELFEALDANGDERINYSDFLAATMQTRSWNRERNVRACFHRLDADRSGAISADDFRAVVGETFEGVDVEELVAEADPDNVGEISFDAFIRLLDDRDATTPAHTPIRSEIMDTFVSCLPPLPSGDAASRGASPSAPCVLMCDGFEKLGGLKIRPVSLARFLEND